VAPRVVIAVLLAATLLAACGTASSPPLPDGTGYAATVPSVVLSVLACEPLAWCVAGGTNPASSTGTASIEVSAGGRAKWAPAATPPLPSTTLTAAGCWSSGCLLGGAGPSGSVLVIVNPARKVASTTASHPPGSGVSALTCVAPGRCLALVTATTDTAVFLTTNSGASWTQRSTLPAGLAVATAASCANPADCVVVGTGAGGVAAAARSVDGGVRWRAAAVPHGLQTFTSVSCGSARWCLATARRPNGTAILLKSTDGGLAWTVMAISVATPAAVTCTAIPTCVAAGGAQGGAITVDVRTHSPRALTLVYVPDPIVAVACATPVKCTAITEASTVSFVG